MPTRNRRPRKDPERTIGNGILVQVRFERIRHPEVKAAAEQAGLPVTAWVRTVIYREIEAQKRKTQKQK